MNFKKNRRLMFAKSILQNNVPKKEEGAISGFVKMPIVRYVASGVAAYNLIRLAMKSAAASINNSESIRA